MFLSHYVLSDIQYMPSTVESFLLMSIGCAIYVEYIKTLDYRFHRQCNPIS